MVATVQEAFTDLQHMINCNEKCVKALQAKAEMLLNEGKPQDSIATYSTAIRHDPENAGLYLRRAELYEEVCVCIALLVTLQISTWFEQ